MAMTILVLPSCKSVSSVECLKSNVNESKVESQKLKVNETDIQHSILRDSIVYREKVVHDTVYITKEVYRDQRLSTFDIQHSTKADTVVVTEYRDRIVEHPPEKYVPKFYKWCTGLFWAIGLLAIGYWLLKWWIKCRV